MAKSPKAQDPEPADTSMEPVADKAPLKPGEVEVTLNVHGRQVIKRLPRSRK